MFKPRLFKNQQRESQMKKNNLIHIRINPNKIRRRKQHKENEGTCQLSLLNLGKQKNVAIKKIKEECYKVWRRKARSEETCTHGVL
jgi:hypothetical protein